MRNSKNSPYLTRLAAVLTVAVLVGAVAEPASQHTLPNLLEPESLVEKWGVELRGIRMSAAGHMLDFRYRVIDPVKAAPLFVRKTKPYLIDVASGKSLTVPVPAKTGPLRNSNPPIAGRTYFMFFGNAGRLVKPGGQVTVVIGDFRAENLTVE